MNLLVISISIIIHTLILVGVYYANLENQSGNKVTKAVGVDTVVGTKINIKMIAVNKPDPSRKKTEKKVTPTASAEKSITMAEHFQLVTKAKTAIGFVKQEINNSPVVKKVTKPPTKTLRSLTHALQKPEIVKTIKAKIPKKTIDKKDKNSDKNEQCKKENAKRKNDYYTKRSASHR